MTLLALSALSAQAAESCSLFVSFSVIRKVGVTEYACFGRSRRHGRPAGEFKSSVNQHFHFISESQKGYGSGGGRVKGGGIGD